MKTYIHINLTLQRTRFESRAGVVFIWDKIVSQSPRSRLSTSKTSVHSKKRTTCSGLMKTALNNVLLPTLFKVVNNTEQVDEPELACNQV